MIKKLAQNLTIFKRLNTKIVIYFLSFAFLPLLVFSIFGYYLNKDLITRINLNHLQSLNAASAKKFNIYLQSKNRIIIHAIKDFQSLEKTVSLQSFLDSRKELFQDFKILKVIPSELDISLQMSNEQRLDAMINPALQFLVGDIHIMGYVSHTEIGELIGSDVKEIQNIVYFLNSKNKLTKNVFETVNEDEILLLTNRISELESRVNEYFF